MAQPDPSTVRYRPFRAAAWGLYLLVAIVFSGAITINVVRSTLAMTPERPPPSTELLTPDACLGVARALLVELDARRNGLSDPPDAGEVRRVDAAWTSFRIEWLTRHNEANSRCSGDGPDRAGLKQIFKGLDSLMDLYTTHAVQFAGEVGPTLDQLRADLRAAGSK